MLITPVVPTPVELAEQAMGESDLGMPGWQRQPDWGALLLAPTGLCGTPGIGFLGKRNDMTDGCRSEP